MQPRPHATKRTRPRAASTLEVCTHPEGEVGELRIAWGLGLGRTAAGVNESIPNPIRGCSCAFKTKQIFSPFQSVSARKDHHIDHCGVNHWELINA